MTASTPQLSIVGSVFQGKETIEAFCRRVNEVVAPLGMSHEVVIVDDGSSDGTYEILERLQSADPNLRVIRFSRNFGHHAAVTAALDHSRGEYVFMLDTDMQDDPGWLPGFLDKLRDEKVDVVYGHQTRRAGGLKDRIAGGMFWWVFNKISEVKVPNNAVTARVMTRRYVDALIKLRESERFMAGMAAWVGFPQVGVPVTRAERGGGKTTYTFTKKVRLLLAAVTSFSAYPLRVATRAGLFMAFVGLAYGAYIVVHKLLYPASVVSGWASLGSMMLIIGGMNLAMLGIVGLYLARTYEQAKGRPLYIVMEELGEPGNDDPAGPSR